MDRVNPWSLECLQPLPCQGRVTEDAGGVGAVAGSVSILRSRVRLPLQTRGMPETLGYRWQGAVWYRGRTCKMGAEENSQGLPGLCEPFFFNPDNYRYKTSWFKTKK